MIGGTKDGEYQRTIEMIKQKVNCYDDKTMMYVFYFLHDIQYGNQDLLNMAELLAKRIELNKKLITSPK